MAARSDINPDIDSDIALSIVIPVKDEAEQIKPLLERLAAVIDALDLTTEILFVNDGSKDDTLARLLKSMSTDERIGVIDLSRNFGKEAALAAGMHHARGRAVITMDADLQDPPETIPEFIKHWRDGADMVVGQNVSIHYRSSDWFYRIFNYIGDTKLVPHAGDFRLFDRRVVEAYRQLGERTRFNKGLFAWLGFQQHILPYQKALTKRRSRWRFIQLFMLALDALVSFSTMPLRIWTILGFFIALTATGFAGFIIASTLIYGADVPGYASLMVVMLLTGGINMIGIGLLGEYISRAFTETKRRPLYIIRKNYHKNYRKDEA